MSQKLSDKEIELRLQRLRNVERFYVELKEKYQHLKEENTMLKEIIKGQSEQIELLKLQVEELRQMVFGKAKKKPNQSDDNQTTTNNQRSKPNRDSGSYRRMKPKDDEITDVEHHALICCPDCGSLRLSRKNIVL